jgi:hypothetical protein
MVTMNYEEAAGYTARMLERPRTASGFCVLCLKRGTVNRARLCYECSCLDPAEDAVTLTAAGFAWQFDRVLGKS